MREPAFWYRPPSWVARITSPISAVYGGITAHRMSKPGADAGIPVICIGNYHLGGAGKTPTTLKIADILSSVGESPFVVSRGYGGQLRGPVLVDANLHRARDVGDEPLMMASRVPVVVARDRAAGAMYAKSEGASVVLLDDGFQNPSVRKDASLIVIDSERGIGNGFVFPAGPLRAPLSEQIDRTDALIVIGNGQAADYVATKVAARGAPVIAANFEPQGECVDALRGQRVLAFAGIGDPARFFSSLRSCDADVVETKIFSDHHPFSPDDLDNLSGLARAKSLTLVTTEKDAVRIASDSRIAHHAATISVFKIALAFENEDAVRGLLIAWLAHARTASQ